ncbi:MerR family transcriptional regulator [Streptomyces noursei]|uniref:MerR HTH family regulatory protein n=1 Tax=Streptomyces yunnanensis TaxID=156453 RepID=A0A9X8N8F0_9ACTN|nr:MerR HTH family regulatory protein [Streptomyces yunnanensis]
MRLAELSQRSGVSTATIKYYLREGLLQPGAHPGGGPAVQEPLGSVRRIMRMPGAWSRSVAGPASTRQAGQSSIAW